MAAWENEVRLGGLRRFAIAITVLNLLGHFYLGFEQSWAHPLAGLAAAYGMELLLEWTGSVATRRRPGYAGGFRALVDFLLPAHITGLACAMLLFSNEQLWPVAFAATVAIGSKTLLRAPGERGARHFFNPSNFGIAVTLVCFPWVGIAPPYMFTEAIDGAADWILPGIIVCSGSFLNARFTRRLPLIGAWIAGFVLQAVVRHWLTGSSLAAAMMPLTGVSTILFTFYMLTEPATTPARPLCQAAFGAAVAAFYGILMAAQIVFGLFFALCIVSLCRGAWLYTSAWERKRRTAPAKPELAAAAQEA